MSQTLTNVRPLSRKPETPAQEPQQGFLQRWFVPHSETQTVTQQAKGVFLPYPLLAIMVTVGVLLISGIIAIQVQVSNLSTTLLLRDADYREQQRKSWEKIEQLEVYIHNDREKLVGVEKTLEVREHERKKN